MSNAPNPQHRCTSCGVLVCILAMAACLATPPALAAPIDEFRISDIEQKIRDLETLTREHSRRISELQPGLPGSKSTPAAIAGNTTSGSRDLRWVNAASWNRIKPGMSELQVVEVLGPPTQTRIADDNQSRQLLYALEIGSSGYLGGRITFSNGMVSAVETPTLK